MKLDYSLSCIQPRIACRRRTLGANGRRALRLAAIRGAGWRVADALRVAFAPGIRKEAVMRDHSQHIQLSREDAVAATLAALDAQPEGFGWRGRAASADHAGKVERKLVERVSLAESVGRVLAYDVCAASDVPSALTCAMDSIALHWSDFADLADGEVPDTSSWVRGRDWQFANTGVAMPEGFDTAIVIEHAQVSADEQHVIIDAAPSRPGAGTRPVGSTMRCGDVLGRAGQLITPDLAARMGSGNNGSVPVVRRPRVAFIPTGNELVAPGVPFDPDRAASFAARGRNFETNSVLVKAKCEQWGGRFIPFDIVPDRRDAIEEAIAQAVEVADIVVLNAGSSKGSDDWSCEVMEQMGRMICHQTNHGPGHHSSFAIVDGTPIVGISGPSAGASFTLNFYLRPLMRAFSGLDPEVPCTPMVLAEAFPAGGHGPKGHGGPVRGEDRPAEHPAHKPGEPEFFGIKLLRAEHAEDGTLRAWPVPGRPGSPESFEANAYYMLPNGPGIEAPKPGDVIWAEWR